MYGRWLDIADIELNIMTGQCLWNEREMLTRGIGALLTKRRNNEVNKIERLKRSISKKCTSEDFEHVNKCIDGISIEEIKALICQLEGNGYQANAYAVMSICYSFAIGLISITNIVNSREKDIFDYIFSLAVVVGTVVLVFVAISIKNNNCKEAYILKALNFKLEELNNKNPNKISDEENDYNEYIVKISEK